MVKVTSVDMFPYTMHVECVSQIVLIEEQALDKGNCFYSVV